MKVVLKAPFASIQDFNDLELPDLTVLTGLNGSGKTQLLHGLQTGKVEVEGYAKERVISFHSSNFHLDDEAASEIDPRKDGDDGVWERLTGRRPSFRTEAKTVRDEFPEAYTQAVAVCGEFGRSLWGILPGDLPEDIYADLERYRDGIEKLLLSRKGRGSQVDASILAVAKRLPVGIHEVSREDFMQAYTPIRLKNGLLVSQLGMAFANYYTKFDKNRYNAYRKSDLGEDVPVYSDLEFESRFGPKPWDVLNEIIEQVGGVRYKVNNPEGLGRGDSFQLKLLDASNPELAPKFSQLSSGERVLMALVSVVYGASSDGLFDGVLLLDEIDASLHPSMIKSLFWVIEEFLIRAGMKVIMVTHSPTTVALAPEEAIHLMKRDGADRVVKCSRETAMDTLTEGFVTLDRGLKIFDSLSTDKIVVVSEGKNTKFIEAALRHWEITGVEVLAGVEDMSGITQLKTLFDFLQRIPHESKVMFVWDCDAASKSNIKGLSDGGNTYPFIFDQNADNKLAAKGVENLFAEELFEGFCFTITSSLGQETKSFDGARKNDFADHVLGRDRKEDFELFAPLMERIKEIKDADTMTSEARKAG